jgi:hypothetical protein
MIDFKSDCCGFGALQPGEALLKLWGATPEASIRVITDQLSASCFHLYNSWYNNHKTLKRRVILAINVRTGPGMLLCWVCVSFHDGIRAECLPLMLCPASSQ